MSCDGPELGYNYLNTAFTGTYFIPASSSDPETEELFRQFAIPQDRGVANTLENTELKSYFQ
jgi:hypothetical protein